MSKSSARPAQVSELLSVALALGARSVPGWTPEEERLVRDLPEPMSHFSAAHAEAIRHGEDALGDWYCRLFTSEERRPAGATYTPAPIVDAMLEWAASEATPERVIDPGAGSGRFLVAAGRTFPEARLVASEIDPLAAILARAHLAAAGFAERSRVVVGDYRQLDLPRIAGRTLFLGNPPYVRHHLIDKRWKQWLTETARKHGHQASQLAGLHVHFFLATAEHARPGDVGALITAAEWLDVNYGRLVRELLLGILGGKTLHIIEPTADPFPGTQSTGVITGFVVGAEPVLIGLKRVDALSNLGSLQTDWFVRRDRLATADRWTLLSRPAPERREGFVELGDVCRVHRGQVTGANDIWIADGNPFDLPEEVLYASVTKARELFAAGDALDDDSQLRRVIDLPHDLADLEATARARVDTFLRFAQSKGADRGFVARNRKAWWSVGLREPAPILATYMARRPPAFVRNLAAARHINIAHGLYPRVVLSEEQLSALAKFLSQTVRLAEGRTYAGGLTKFEPREMERLLVPEPQLLTEASFAAAD